MEERRDKIKHKRRLAWSSLKEREKEMGSYLCIGSNRIEVIYNTRMSKKEEKSKKERCQEEVKKRRKRRKEEVRRKETHCCLG